MSLRLLLLLAPVLGWCGRTQEVGRRTFWDDIMEAQAARTVYEGAALLDAKRYQEAVRAFSRAVIAAPEDPQARRMLGVAYYWTGQVDRAEVEFKESLRLEPGSAQSHLLLGIARAWKGDGDKAYESFKEAYRLDPSRADICMNLGSIEETLGLVPEALAHFRKAVDLDDTHPLYHFQLGMLYRRLGRDEDAVGELSKALRRYPGYQDATLELAAAYERMGKRKEALDLFRKAVRQKSRDAVARFRLARAWLLQGKEKDARDALREVFHLTPADPGQGLALSLAYGGQRQGKPSEAPEKPAEPEPPAGGPQGPLDVLSRNLARVPLDQEAVLHVDMAFIPRPRLVKAKRGETPSSLKSALEKAGKPPPGNILASRRDYTLRGSTPEERAKEIEAVLSDVRSALEGAPEGAETRFGMNLSFKPKPAAGSGGGGEPQPSVSYNPHDVGNDLGLWVMGTGWTDLVEEAVGEERRTGSSWWLLEGIGQALLGNSGQALECFSRALVLDPREELAHLGRGVALVIAGDEAGAAEAYRKALALNPKNRAASEGLKWLQKAPVTQQGGKSGR